MRGLRCSRAGDASTSPERIASAEVYDLRRARSSRGRRLRDAEDLCDVGVVPYISADATTSLIPGLLQGADRNSDAIGAFPFESGR